jgi:hypothetical protein
MTQQDRLIQKQLIEETEKQLAPIRNKIRENKKWFCNEEKETPGTCCQGIIAKS